MRRASTRGCSKPSGEKPQASAKLQKLAYRRTEVPRRLKSAPRGAGFILHRALARLCCCVNFCNQVLGPLRGLIPALKWQAREVSKRTSMDVSVATELDSDDLPDEYKTCIYRVVQEALHNCERHSHAKAVRIRVQQEPDRLVLKIQDDGRGFEARQTKGLGLLGIQERVAQLGGQVKIHSQPGSGTILAVEWPIALSHENHPHPAR